MSSISKIRNQLESLASSLQNLPASEKEAALNLVESTLIAQRQKKSTGVSCQKPCSIHNNITSKSESESKLSGSHDILNRVSEHQRPCTILLPQQEEILSRSPESTSLSQGRFPFEKGQAQQKKKGTLLQKRRRTASLFSSDSGTDAFSGQKTMLPQLKIKENCRSNYQSASKRKSCRKSLQIPLQKKRKFSPSIEKASMYCSTAPRKSIAPETKVDAGELSNRHSISRTVREEAKEALKVLPIPSSSSWEISAIREQVSQAHDEIEKVPREETKSLSFVREIHQQTQVSLRGSESIQRILQKIPRPIGFSGSAEGRDWYENSILHIKDEGPQKSLQLPQDKKSFPPKQTGIPQISNASVIVPNDSLSPEKQQSQSENKCEPHGMFAPETCSEENSVKIYDSVEMFPSYVWSEEDKSKMPEDLREATLNLEKSLSRLKEQQQLHLMQHRSTLESDVVDVLSVDSIDESNRHQLTDSVDKSHYTELYSDQDKTMTTNLLDRSLHLLGLSQPDFMPSKNVDTPNMEFSSQNRDVPFDENEASTNYNVDEPTDLTISSEMKEKNLANQIENQLKMDHLDQININCKSTYPQSNSSYPLYEYGTDMCHTDSTRNKDYYSQQHLISNETNVVYDLSISASKGNDIETSFVSEVSRQDCSTHLEKNVCYNSIGKDQPNLTSENPLIKDKLQFSDSVDDYEIDLRSDETKLSDVNVAIVPQDSEAKSVNYQFVSNLTTEVNEKKEKLIETIGEKVGNTDENLVVSSGYYCKFCSKRFRLKSNYESHVKGHSRHNCSVCGCSYSSYKALYVHCKKNHNIKLEGKTYDCSSCSKKFTKKIHLNAHIIRLHRRDNQCTKCSAEFVCEKKLQEHVKSHASFSCSLCQRSFEKRRNLLRHIDSHRRNECKICKESFSNKNTLVAHQREKHIQKRKQSIVSVTKSAFKAAIHSSDLKEKKSTDSRSIDSVDSIPEKIVPSICSTSNTESSHDIALLPTHICTLCNRSFCRPSLLREHQDIVHTKSQVLSCEVCQKTYSSRKSLRKHLESKLHQEKMIDSKLESLHSCRNVTLKQSNLNISEDLSVEQLLNTSEVKAVNHEKAETDQNANTISSYHEQSNNIDTGEIAATVSCTDTLLYKCQSCDFESAYSTSMRRHAKLHQTVKRFICELCGKMLATHSGLKEHHVFVHSKNRNFACSLCSKSFKNNSTLNRHLREHSGSRANVCTECGASYKRVSHLKRHVNTAHATKIKGASKKSDCDQNNVRTVDMSDSSVKDISVRSVLSVPSYVLLSVTN